MMVDGREECQLRCQIEVLVPDTCLSRLLLVKVTVKMNGWPEAHTEISGTVGLPRRGPRSKLVTPLATSTGKTTVERDTHRHEPVVSGP
jgi:hypothetical protein